MSWASMPLKRVASLRVSNVDKKSVDGEVPVRLCNYTDVYYRDVIRTDQEFMAATATREQVAGFRLQPGDVIITKDSETADDIGVPAFVETSASDLVCGYHLALIRPIRQLIDGRFFFWSMTSAIVRDELALAATGVTRYGLRTDSMSTVAIPLPKMAQQRAIADYLDTETARIDALIEKKRRMVDLLEERLTELLERVIWHDVNASLPLARLTQESRPIMYGIVLPGPDVPEGISLVKGGDVAAGRLSPGLLNRTAREIEAPYVRARLRAGDLVFAIRGGIGDVAIVPEELTGANITQDVARVSRAVEIDPEWLLMALRTRSVQTQVSQRVVGATIRGLNIWDLKRVPVPDSPPTRRQQDLDFLRPVEERHQRLTASLRRQVTLLAEHRQALITAAVTGQLAIPRVAA